MTASEALDTLMGDCSSRCREAVAAVLRDALAAKDAELDEYRTQVAIAFGYDGPLGPAMFSIVEAVAEKDAEIARLTNDNGELEEVYLLDAAYEIVALKRQVAALTEERDVATASATAWQQTAVATEQREIALRARVTTIAEECEYRARHLRGLTEQLEALTEERDQWEAACRVASDGVARQIALTEALTKQRDRLMAALARWPMSSEYEALATAHAALRASITTGVTCTCRRYDYVGTRVCWRCAALAAAPGAS